MSVFFFSGKQAAVRLKNASADRNVQPILDCLHKVLDKDEYGLRLLEVSSGTGQHVASFAPTFPNIAFYPSEYETSMFGSIRAFTERLSNVAFPMTVDVSVEKKSIVFVLINFILLCLVEGKYNLRKNCY